MDIPSTRRGSSFSVLVDTAVGVFSGLGATLVTNVAQKPLGAITPADVDRHEKRVRPGASSSLVAAQKIARGLGASLSQREEALLGKAIHLGVGACWGPVYGILRRYGRLRPIGAALTTGLTMSLVLDEGLVPALGLSAPNHHYHHFTRARGFIAHLVYGAAVAAATEGLNRLVDPYVAKAGIRDTSPPQRSGHA